MPYRNIFLVLLLAGLMYNCSESTSPGDPILSLSITSSTAGLPKAAAPQAITLDSIKVLIRDIKLHIPSSQDSSISVDSCYVHLGTFVVRLNTSGTVNTIASNQVPAGTYDRVKFEIHKVEDTETPPDPAFKEGTSGNLRYSVLIYGSYNSTPFVYKSTKSSHQVINFDTPLVVAEGTTTNLTLVVDPAGWFMNGNTELNPTDPANSNTIDDNIKDSFRGVYKDNNKDGLPD